MTPPPDDNGKPTGNQDDLSEFVGDEIDPMQWLESLAARQGANREEFVTTADLEVPEVPPDTVIDEPGYVEYDPFGSSAPSPPAAPPPAAPPPAPEPPVASVEEPAPAADDPLGGADPMAWLESLARRQGANTEELMTSADLEVPEVSPDTVIDEPGYTPYDISGGGSARAASPPPPAPEPIVPEPAPPAAGADFFPQGDLSASDAAALLGVDTDALQPAMAEPAPAAPAPPPPAPAAAAPAGDDPLGGADPMAWLESLARRQGANTEELMTSADLEVPEVSPDTYIDEPGYTPYDISGGTTRAASPPPPPPAPATESVVPEAIAPEPAPPSPAAPEPAAEAATPDADDTLAWLEGLAAEQAEMEAEVPLPAAPPPPAAASDPLAGLSDEEIEALAARGSLSAEQMQAWLTRQAASLASARQVEGDELSDLDDLAPPEPAEIPFWLEEAMAEQGAPPPAQQQAPLVEQITEPPEPADLPDWLDQPPADVPTEAGLSELLEKATQDEASDPWAEALDAEYETQILQADDEEPAWYRYALEDPERQEEVERKLAEQPAADASPAADEPEEDVELARAELPDWLQASAEAPVPAAPAPAEASPFPVDEAATEDMPDWLTEQIPAAEPANVAGWLDDQEAVVAEADLAPAEIPDWLQNADQQAVEVPDWMQAEAPAPAEPEPAPPVAPAPAAPPPPVQPVAITVELPPGPAYASFRSALEQNPEDHATRLQLARTLVQNAELAASLGQYEALVRAQAQLTDLENDLRGLVTANPGVPQARRVLGDAIMRQGRLQDALDTYRAALEQL